MLRVGLILRLFVILSIFFNTKNIFCIQLKIKLEKQVYQHPVNNILYRRLSNEPLRELSYYEYERPNIKLALPVVSIDIGYPPQNFSLIYSTGKQVTWVYRDKSNYDKLSQKYFDTEKSKTLIKYKDIYELNSFTFGTLCSKVQDYISINNNISTFMSFMLIFFLSPNSLFADGELSLIRKYLGIYSDPYITKNVSNFSLLEGLYNDNHIKRRIFAHKWNYWNYEGILYIGEYPLSEEEKPYYNLHICNSYNERGEINQFWNCFVDGIKIGDKYIYYNNTNNNNEIGIFSTSEKFIFVPERNYEVIEYIKNYSNWGKLNCIMEGITAFKELHCDYNTFKYSYFPDVYINFNGYEIKLTPEDIFYYNDNKKFYRLLMVLYTKKDYWVFGSLLTNKNNMIFDGDNGTVTFFKKRTLFTSTLLASYLLCALLFLSLIGFYFVAKLYFFNFKSKNHDFPRYSEKAKLIQ